MRRTIISFLFAVALAGCGLLNATEGTVADANMTPSESATQSDVAVHNEENSNDVHRGAEVLIVDNSIIDRQMLSEELTKRGFRVVAQTRQTRDCAFSPKHCRMRF